MAGGDDLRPSTRRGGFVLIAVAIWIVIIVVGSGSEADDSLLGVDNLDVVWITVFGVIVVLSIAFLIYLKPLSSEWVAPKKKRRGAGIWFLVALLVVLLVWRPNFFENLEPADEEEELAGVVEPEIEPVAQEPPPETVAEATDILLLVVGVGAIAGVWFLMKRRTSAGGDDETDQPASALEVDLVKALDDAVRELGASTDPRTAVLRSYAVLETVLGSHGLTRATSETPTEHLGRALQNLRVDAGPLLELGRLYEVARFSERPISKPEQDAAAQALRRAQASLASLV